MDIFAEWQRHATRFTWASTTPANADAEAEVFSRRCGAITERWGLGITG